MQRRPKHHPGEESKHNYYLNNLINNLSKVGERPYDIAWIMKDGIWMPDGTTKRNKLCDLVIVYYDGHGVPIELKGSSKKRQEATAQLESGKRFLEDVIGAHVPYGRFIVYKKDTYINEKVTFKK